MVSGYRTDHSGIILKLKLNQNERGKSYWKFNNSLLKDKDYIQLVKKSVEEVKNTYKIVNIQQNRVNLDNNNNNNNNNNSNNNDNNNIFNNNNNNIHNTYSINDQLLLEMILLAIRGETIKYSSRKKKENSRQEKQLEDEILNLESKITETLQTVSQEDINLLNDKKNRLHEIRKSKIEGVMLRSRCRYEDLGEKPSGYFLNLEKRNFTNKVITKIIEENGQECLSTDEILNSQKTYFKNLYSENIIIDDTPIESKIGENSSRLADNEAELLEGDIKYSELAEALKNMKNLKTPGNDGFTAEFFKFFLD